MKESSVAIIMNGCMRHLYPETQEKLTDFTGYKKVIENINKLLIDFKTVHIYFHTWNPFINTDISIHNYSYDKDLLIKELSTLPNVYSIIIEDQVTEINLDNINANYTEFLRNNMQYKSNRTSIYNCFKSYNTLCDYVKKSGNNYDYILRTRNDLILEFNDFNNILVKAMENHICVPPNLWCPVNPEFINDHWVFARSEYVIKGLCYSSFEEFNRLVYQSWNQEHLTYKHLIKANCPIYIADVLSYNILHLNRKLR